MSFIDHSVSSASLRIHHAVTRLGSSGSQRSAGILFDAQDDVILSSGGMTPLDRTAAEYKKHKRKWKRDTQHLSDPAERYLHRSYVRIIGLGPSAIGLLLRDLQQEMNDWFFALEAMTGESPITAAMAGDVQQMADAWIAWGTTASNNFSG